MVLAFLRWAHFANTMISSPIHFLENDIVSFFLTAKLYCTLHCANNPHLLSWFTSLWTPREFYYLMAVTHTPLHMSVERTVLLLTNIQSSSVDELKKKKATLMQLIIT